MFFDKKNNEIVRPFSDSAAVSCRSRSEPLQKVLVDFGADDSFEKAVEKVKRHYGVDVASSTTRLDVESHAKIIKELDDKGFFKGKNPEASKIIGETDGGMVPIVSQKENCKNIKDKRKNKVNEWKECRLSAAVAHKKITPSYAAVIGSTDEAGDQLAKAVEMAGGGENSSIHFVADGAPWIADQVEHKFGAKATFLLDFYHASEHLAEVAKHFDSENSDSWLRQQQELLKSGKYHMVLEKLKEHCEKKCETEDCGCVVKKCFNYFSKREKYLDYKTAIDSDLPIGSGMVEGGHRSVIQERLKISGAWWTRENANAMISLRILRSNGLWDQYWKTTKLCENSYAYG